MDKQYQLSRQRVEDDLFETFNEAGMSSNDIIDLLVSYLSVDEMEEMMVEIKEYMVEIKE